MMNLNAVCVTGEEAEERRRVRAAVYRRKFVDFVKWDLRQIVPCDIEESAQAALGPDHPAVADCCDQCGFIEWERQRYSSAAGCYEKALAIRERAFGLDHPEVAESLTTLGGLYATAIKKRGSTPKTGDWEMAPVYYRAERKVDAEPLFLRAMEIRKRAFGPDRPAVAASLGNLAGLYANRGEFERARPLAERSLAIRVDAFGPDHPDVALSLANLAMVYQGSGLKREAEVLNARVVAFWLRTLDTRGRAKSNRRVLYFRSTRAEELQPGQIFEATFPTWEGTRPEHPDLAAVLVDFAEKWQKGKYRFSYVEVIGNRIVRRAKTILNRERK